MDLKALLDKAEARLQAEVGRFLILKERIYSLPDGPTKEKLLAEQDRLQSRAMAMASSLADVKSQVSGLKGLAVLTYFADPTKRAQAVSLVSSVSQWVKAAAQQTSAVNAATGQAPSPAPAAPASLSMPPVVKEALTLGAVTFGVYWAWRATRSKAREAFS